MTTTTIPKSYTEMSVDKYEALLAAMKSVPAATHADYSQYDGYWDDWVLVILTRNVGLKGGRGLEFWQVTIGKRERFWQYDDEPGETWSVYSPQRDSNVGGLSLSDVVEIKRVWA